MTASKPKGRKRERTSSILVRFELHGAPAVNVNIAGTFNDWHPSVTEMICVGEGDWVKELTLPPGRYEYQFVVDGRWMQDPAREGSTPNPYGGRNSVLVVKSG